MDREVIKYTLKSYLEDHVNTTPLEQKTETLDKVNNLSVKEFDTFVGDIVNEIHRRTGLEFKNPGKHSMRKKLMQMKDDIFKNLVYDTLEVYHSRYPTNKGDIEDDINNISKIINKLKTEEDINEKIFNESNTSLKYKYFLEYISSRYDTDNDKVVEYIKEYTNNNIVEEVDDSCSIIFNYKLLIDKLNTSKYINLDKYKVYTDNIKRIENMTLNPDIKKDLISGEFFNIIKLIIDNQYFYEEDVIKKNVQHIISTIQGITYFNNETLDLLNKSPLSEQDNSDIRHTISNILSNCKEMPFVSQSHIYKLESINSKNGFVYEDMILIVNLIRSILEDINRKDK